MQTPTDPNVKLIKDTDNEDKESKARPSQARGCLKLSCCWNKTGHSVHRKFLKSVQFLSWEAALDRREASVEIPEEHYKSWNRLSQGMWEAEGIYDADWAGCPMDWRSYTGYAFTFNEQL